MSFLFDETNTQKPKGLNNSSTHTLLIILIPSIQTNNELAKASTGYGAYTLAVTLVYPSLYNKFTKKTKSTTPTQSSLTTGLIIAICLMLSRDIHPCPGPHHLETPREADPRAEDKCNAPTLQCSMTRVAVQCVRPTSPQFRDLK